MFSCGRKRTIHLLRISISLPEAVTKLATLTIAKLGAPTNYKHEITVFRHEVNDSSRGVARERHPFSSRAEGF